MAEKFPSLQRLQAATPMQPLWFAPATREGGAIRKCYSIVVARAPPMVRGDSLWSYLNTAIDCLCTQGVLEIGGAGDQICIGLSCKRFTQRREPRKEFLLWLSYKPSASSHLVAASE